jgi:CheY-like chemotaxis protein
MSVIIRQCFNTEYWDGRMNVLLVEDDDLVRFFILEVLADAGLQVVDVADPGAALAIPDGTGPPKVLVTDVDLGVAMDGFALANAARCRWPLLSVVYISGIPANTYRHRLGCDERFIPKPFSPAVLIQTVQDVAGAHWPPVAARGRESTPCGTAQSTTWH